MLVGKKRSSINLSLFTNFSESFSSSSDHGSKSPNFSSTKSPRNFQDRVVGLGIVVAMSDDSHEALRASKTSRGAVAAAAAARSKPIPIISSNPIVKIPKPIVNKEEMELSESYTCVIAHLENGNSVKKREYFDFPDEDNSWGGGGGGDATGVFFTSPPMKTGMLSVFGDGDFLSSCYLCRKKLLGLDIFMYRGDKAFCSAECRYHQIKSDERKAKRGSGPLKAFDYSVTPCSAPRFVSPGVVAA